MFDTHAIARTPARRAGIQARNADVADAVRRTAIGALVAVASIQTAFLIAVLRTVPSLKRRARP